MLEALPILAEEKPNPLYLVTPSEAPVQYLTRAAAYLVDIVLIGVTSALIINAFLFAYHKFALNFGLVPLVARNPIHIKLFKDIVSMLVFGAYMALSLWYGNGTTWGKNLFSLRVARADGALEWTFKQAMARACAYQISYLLFGLGFAFAFFRQDRRTLHDILTKTSVAYRNPT